jgi:tRNA A37 threonylcarbamoyltransferase TsaD
MEYNTDNAAMIAAAAYVRHLEKKKYKMQAASNLTL